MQYFIARSYFRLNIYGTDNYCSNTMHMLSTIGKLSVQGSQNDKIFRITIVWAVISEKNEKNSNFFLLGTSECFAKDSCMFLQWLITLCMICFLYFIISIIRDRRYLYHTSTVWRGSWDNTWYAYETIPRYRTGITRL